MMNKEITSVCSYNVETTARPVFEVVTRCSHAGCNAILFKGVLGVQSHIELQCRKCKNKTVLMAVTTK